MRVLFANGGAPAVQQRRGGDLTREELIDAMNVGWPGSQYYRTLFDKNVPLSGASSLFAYPENWEIRTQLVELQAYS